MPHRILKILKNRIGCFLRHIFRAWKDAADSISDAFHDIFVLTGKSRSDKFIVSSNSFGLCNRLKCLISSMRLADKFSRNVVLYWPKNICCVCRFSDLFENEMIEIKSDTGLSKIKHDPGKYFIVDTWRLLTLPDDLPKGFSRECPSPRGNDIDHEFGRIPLSIRNEFLRYIKLLVPIKFIRGEVDAFSENFDDETISVYVRSWAGEKHNRNETLFKIEDVYAAMDKHYTGNFFVSTDHREVMKEIIQRYGRRILLYPKRTYQGDRQSKIGMQDALIDLLLLSKNKNLITSSYTTFSEMAWWFGGCKAAVETIESAACLENFRRTLEANDEATHLVPGDLLHRVK